MKDKDSKDKDFKDKEKKNSASTKSANVTETEKKNSAFTRSVNVTDALANIIGSESMPRTEVTKKLWDYIKAHNLQDPNNKRNIIPDAKLAKVLDSTQPIDMFQLTSAISKHITDNAKEEVTSCS